MLHSPGNRPMPVNTSANLSIIDSESFSGEDTDSTSLIMSKSKHAFNPSTGGDYVSTIKKSSGMAFSLYLQCSWHVPLTDNGYPPYSVSSLCVGCIFVFVAVFLKSLSGITLT